MSDAQTPQQPTEQPLVTPCAFMVYLHQDGRWVADSTALNRPVVTTREATMVDFGHAVADIERDISVSSAAKTTVTLFQQSLMQAAEAAQSQRIAEATGTVPGGGVDLSKLKH